MASPGPSWKRRRRKGHLEDLEDIDVDEAFGHPGTVKFGDAGDGAVLENCACLFPDCPMKAKEHGHLCLVDACLQWFVCVGVTW